ncbi:MAG TPA: ComF family protein [Nitrosospira sp.]|nr:ComF family protein [Nitrosospira sp.]
MMRPLFVKHCVLCGAVAEKHFCLACRESLPYLPSLHCVICALPLPQSGVCGACLVDPPAFDQIVAAANYAFPVDALIHSLKYQANLTLAPVLGDLLTARLDLADPLKRPDFIVPMPLHPRRLRERGFNQALEISRRVSKTSGIPTLPAVCRRIEDTSSQTGLPWKEREKNIRNAFVCERDLAGKHVAILDDVMTTGATLNELAKVLRKCGAACVSGWVVARTLSSDHTKII